jgi:hypothetical protein
MSQGAQTGLLSCLKVPMKDGRKYSETCDACKHAPTSVMVHGSSHCKRCYREQAAERLACSCGATLNLTWQLPENVFLCPACN